MTGRTFSKINARTPFRGYKRTRTLHKRSLPRTLSGAQRRQLKRIVGYRKRARPLCYGCNLAFLEQLSRAIQSTMATEWDRNGQRDLEFVSFTPESWIVSELSPLVDLRTWRSEVSRWLKMLGLTGIGIIEAVPFLNYPWPRMGRAIAFHLHFFGYAENRDGFKKGLKALKARLNPEKRLKMTAVVAKTVRPTASDVMYTTGYGAKAVGSAIRISSKVSKTGKSIIRKAPIPRHLTLRMSDIMSYIRPQELIISRGKAAWEWRKTILAQLGEVAISRRPKRLSDDELNELWIRVWSARCRETCSPQKRHLFRSYNRPIIRR